MTNHSAIPLDLATLCLNCNVITASKHDSCSYCGAKGLCLLSNWLNRTEELHETSVSAAVVDTGAPADGVY